MKLFLAYILLFGSTAFSQSLNNCRVTGQTFFSATTVAAQIVPSKANRRCLTVQNTTGASNVYITFDSGGTAQRGVKLSAGTLWAPIVVPMNSIWALGSANGVSTMLIQGE